MATDGGPAFPFPTHDERGAVGQWAHGGMTVRDAFAMAIIASGLWPSQRENQSALEYASILRRHGREIYDGAQIFADEKLGRDKADRDEGKVD